MRHERPTPEGLIVQALIVIPGMALIGAGYSAGVFIALLLGFTLLAAYKLARLFFGY